MVKRRNKVTELERTAYHEAGHAFMAYDLRRKFHFITIDPEKLDKNTEGMVKMVRSNKLFEAIEFGDFDSRTLTEKQIKITLGGEVACGLLVGPKSCHLSQDAQVSMHLAQSQCGNAEEADAYLNWLWLSVRNQLRLPHNWACVQALAKALMKHKTLSYRKAREIIRTARDKYSSQFMP